MVSVPYLNTKVGGVGGGGKWGGGDRTRQARRIRQSRHDHWSAGLDAGGNGQPLTKLL